MKRANFAQVTVQAQQDVFPVQIAGKAVDVRLDEGFVQPERRRAP